MKTIYNEVPFDIEVLKKIQSREIDGKVKMACRENAANCDICTYIIVDALDHISTKEYAVMYHMPNMGPQRALIYIDTQGKYKYDKPNLCYGQAGYLVLELAKEIDEFIPFDKVLVRRPDDYSGTLKNIWVPAYYQITIKESGYFGERKYLASGIFWKECVPYDGNELLAGTTDNPK